MASFFTRKGDDGTTGMLGKERINKFDLRMETLGTLDEVSAVLGLARSKSNSEETKTTLLKIQRELYLLMAETAATKEISETFSKIDENHVSWLEEKTEQFGNNIQLTPEFIVPGDTESGAALDFARTVVRRAERRMAELSNAKMVENKYLLVYINRLSSLIFVLELFENQISGFKKPTLAKED